MLTLVRCSAALGLALALGGCSSPGTEAKADDLGAEVASVRPSNLAKRSTPAGLAMATLGLFKDGELDPSQQSRLNALRGSVVSAQQAVGTEIVSHSAAARGGAADAPDLEALGAAMAEKQHALVDRALVGALELRATLSPAQRAAFVLRAKEHERAARRHAGKLAQARADILLELANPVPDETRIRALGHAFVTSHARANGASSIAAARPAANP